MWRWLGSTRGVKVPETHCGCAATRQDNGIIVGDRDTIGIKSDVAPGIAQLTHGDKGVRSKVWYNMHMASGKRQLGHVQLAFVGGIHDGSVRILDGNGVFGDTFVVEILCVDSEEMCCTASVSNGRGTSITTGCWRWGGRTYRGTMRGGAS